jgi:hypothetical protein
MTGGRSMQKQWITGVALGVWAATPSWAVTITFDDLAAGTVLSNQRAEQGVSFSANSFTGPGSSSSGQARATYTDMTIVSSTGTDVGFLGVPPLVSGNVLRSFAGWLNEDGDPSFLISFSTRVSSMSLDFTGVFGFADVTLWAYDGATLLGTVSGTSGGQFTLGFAAASITSVAVRPGTFDDWVAVDNLVFAPVPETSTYAMMALGLAALGIAARRRKA